jgi:hypothetical protein
LFTAQSEVWRDPFAHQSDEQQNSGSWYVHDDGRRAPSYSGIDITAGSRSLGIYAGLLIRELDRNDGSARALQTIVRGEFSSERKGNVWSSAEKSAISSIHQSSVFSGPLKLVRRAEPREGELWIGPRWGLNSKTHMKFVECPLRIATWQTEKHKTKMRQYKLDA